MDTRPSRALPVAREDDVTRRARVDVVEDTALPGLIRSDRRFAAGDPDRCFELPRGCPFVAIDPGRDGAAVFVQPTQYWPPAKAPRVVPFSDAAVLVEVARAFAQMIGGPLTLPAVIVVEDGYIGTLGGSLGGPRGVVLGQIANTIARTARTNQIVGMLATMLAEHGRERIDGVHVLRVSPATWQASVLGLSSRAGREALKKASLEHAAETMTALGFGDERKAVREGIADALGIAAWFARGRWRT